MIHNSHEDTTVFLLIKQFPHEGAEITEGTDKTLDADIKQIKNILSHSRFPGQKTPRTRGREGNKERFWAQIKEANGKALKAPRKILVSIREIRV